MSSWSKYKEWFATSTLQKNEKRKKAHHHFDHHATTTIKCINLYFDKKVPTSNLLILDIEKSICEIKKAVSKLNFVIIKPIATVLLLLFKTNKKVFCNKFNKILANST